MEKEECLNCGTTENLTFHHVTPQRLGGSDEDWNLQVLCRTCHDKLEAGEIGVTTEYGVKYID